MKIEHALRGIVSRADFYLQVYIHLAGESWLTDKEVAMRAFRNFAVAVLAVVALALGGCGSISQVKPDGVANGPLKVASVSLGTLTTSGEEGAVEAGKEFLAEFPQALAARGLKVVPDGKIRVDMEIVYQRIGMLPFLPPTMHRAYARASVIRDGKVILSVARGAMSGRAWSVGKSVAGMVADDIAAGIVTP